ncbi:MAG: NIPSNAP family protein [Terriglobia bacterium]
MMRRRDWLAGSLAASTFLGLTARSDAQSAVNAERGELYELRRYQLRNGPQPKRMDDYLRDALVPALNRAGVKPVGVFHGLVGPENPAVYVLIPYSSLTGIEGAQYRVARDEEYQRRAADYMNASAAQPAYQRFETSLLQAFETVPRIQVPPATAEHKPRIFELRTYENPSEKANLTKLKMFNTAEISIFRRTGLRAVFFGNTIMGTRMPCLTYMLTFSSLAEREKNWAIFGSDPEWQKLRSTPEYTDAEIINNISNIFLAPAPYSQI